MEGDGLSVHLIAALAVAFASGAASPVAHAQASGADRDRPRAVAEVVVTARKREESLQSVPLAVSTLTGAALEQRNIRQPADLGRTVPSLVIQNGTPGAVNDAAISLRAQVASDILLNVSQPVALYEDGVNIPHPIGANGAFFDLRRVEVLKGPQGTLYGRNTTGGAIDIITRGPDFEGVHGYVLGEIGNYSDVRYGGAVNVPIVRDAISARLAVLHWGREGYGRSRVTGQRLGGDHDDDLVRLSLQVAPPGPVRVDLKYEQYRARRNGPLSTARFYSGDIASALEAAAYTDFATYQPLIFRGAAFGDQAALGTAIAAGRALIASCVGDELFTSCQGAITHDDVRTRHGVVDITWDVGSAATLRSLTGYHAFKNDRSFDLDGLPYQIVEVGIGAGGLQPDLGSAPGPSPVFPYPAPHDQASKQISQEFNLSGRYGAKLDWLVGAYWADDRGAGAQPFLSVPTLMRALSPTGTGSIQVVGHSALRVTNSTWALFSQEDLRFTQRLSLTLGARYTEERLGQTLSNWVYQTGTGQFSCSTASLASRGPQATLEGCAADASAKFSGTSYLASLNFQWTPDALFYAKTARGFRGGSLQGRDSDAPPIAPEIAVDYEIGLKSDVADHRLRANLAAYQTDYRNKQEQTVTLDQSGALRTIVQNAAQARIRGLEAEVTARPTPQLTLFFNGSYIDAVYLSFPAALTPDGVADASGTSFSIPKYQADFGAQYSHDLGPGEITVQADYAYHSQIPLTDLNRAPPPFSALEQEMFRGRGLVNARVDYSLRTGLTASLFATNLLDDRYQVFGVNALNLGGVQNGLTQEPRMYGLAVRQTFGRE